jgi:hypothetical protein
MPSFDLSAIATSGGIVMHAISHPDWNFTFK